MMYHCTITYRERTFDGRGDTERSMLLVGTSEEIGKQVAQLVQGQLESGGRVLTITPIHPANVWKASA